tara:strand:- start:153 stop:446 length:294 start_codon:yes stop_codon:yes gene_type:complete
MTDTTYHDYDCAMQYGDTVCDCNLSDARERWTELMLSDQQHEANGQEMPSAFLEEMHELKTAIDAHDRIIAGKHTLADLARVGITNTTTSLQEYKGA